MATFQLEVPDAAASRVMEALVVNYGYQEEIPDPDNPGEMIPNPQSHTDFAMDQVKNFLMQNVRSYESAKATREAIANVKPIEI